MLSLCNSTFKDQFIFSITLEYFFPLRIFAHLLSVKYKNRAFLHDVTAKNNGTAAMLVSQINYVGVEPFSVNFLQLQEIFINAGHMSKNAL